MLGRNISPRPRAERPWRCSRSGRPAPRCPPPRPAGRARTGPERCGSPPSRACHARPRPERRPVPPHGPRHGQDGRGSIRARSLRSGRPRAATHRPRGPPCRSCRDPFTPGEAARGIPRRPERRSAPLARRRRGARISAHGPAGCGAAPAVPPANVTSCRPPESQRRADSTFLLISGTATSSPAAEHLPNGHRPAGPALPGRHSDGDPFPRRRARPVRRPRRPHPGAGLRTGAGTAAGAGAGDADHPDRGDRRERDAAGRRGRCPDRPLRTAAPPGAGARDLCRPVRDLRALRRGRNGQRVLLAAAGHIRGALRRGRPARAASGAVGNGGAAGAGGQPGLGGHDRDGRASRPLGLLPRRHAGHPVAVIACRHPGRRGHRHQPRRGACRRSRIPPPLRPDPLRGVPS